MEFDIHQLDRVPPEFEQGEGAFEAFQEAMVDRFLQSPEGQERLKADRDLGFWAAQLMCLGYQYEGKSLPRMTADDVRTVVTELFPSKISMLSPEEADDTIPELLAFWNFLKREFQLPQADAVLELLRDVERDFPGMMNDPRNFGFAKSFFMMGQAAGFDMTTEEGMDAFMLTYNVRMLADQLASGPSVRFPSFSAPTRRLDPAAWRAVKKKRKQAEQARKRNRKRRK